MAGTRLELSEHKREGAFSRSGLFPVISVSNSASNNESKSEEIELFSGVTPDESKLEAVDSFFPEYKKSELPGTVKPIKDLLVGVLKRNDYDLGYLLKSCRRRVASKELSPVFEHFFHVKGIDLPIPNAPKRDEPEENILLGCYLFLQRQRNFANEYFEMAKTQGHQGAVLCIHQLINDRQRLPSQTDLASIDYIRSIEDAEAKNPYGTIGVGIGAAPSMSHVFAELKKRSLRQVAEKNYAPALYDLASLLLKEHDSQFWITKMWSQSEIEARDLLKRASLRRYGNASIKLAELAISPIIKAGYYVQALNDFEIADISGLAPQTRDALYELFLQHSSSPEVLRIAGEAIGQYYPKLGEVYHLQIKTTLDSVWNLPSDISEICATFFTTHRYRNSDFLQHLTKKLREGVYNISRESRTPLMRQFLIDIEKLELDALRTSAGSRMMLDYLESEDNRQKWQDDKNLMDIIDVALQRAPKVTKRLRG